MFKYVSINDTAILVQCIGEVDVYFSVADSSGCGFIPDLPEDSTNICFIIENKVYGTEPTSIGRLRQYSMFEMDDPTVVNADKDAFVLFKSNNEFSLVSIKTVYRTNTSTIDGVMDI